MKVIIMTEGSKSIGFGHITRCLSIYQAFKEKNIPVEFMINGDSTIETIIKNTEYKIFNWLKYPNKLFGLLEESDIVILDSYLAHGDFYKRISELVELAVYIDDNKRIDYPEGIVVNGSILATKLNYTPKAGVDYLLDSNYMPLRREFWDVAKKEIKSTVQSVMVTLGGDDVRNVTPKILKFLIKKYPQVFKNIVIGKGFENITEIEKLKDGKTELIYYPDATGMLKLMMESDVAISAGGQTLYELARVGIPAIAICVAANQSHNIENWKNVGFIELAGYWDDEYLLDNIKKCFELLKDQDVRFKNGENGKKFVDGKGAIRLFKYILNKYYTNKISLRHLRLDDIHDIYELSNENEVRENSFNTNKIEFKDHEKWFKSKLENNKCLFLVIEIDENFAGQVRFDLSGLEATISISITKKFRDIGLGTNIIKSSLDYLKEKLPSIKIVKAYIKEINKRSIKLFEKSDFIYKQNVCIDTSDALEYIHKIRD